MKRIFGPRIMENAIGVSISAVAFCFYAATLCPTTSFIDSGELATVACTLGIAHPTGYPLFTIVGWLFVHLPLGLRPIHQLNVMAALLCSGGLFFFYKFLVFFLGEFIAPRAGGAGRGDGTGGGVTSAVIPAVCGTLFLAFSETYWAQAVAVEVYSLHVVFLSVLLLLFTKAVHAEAASPGKKNYYWYGFAFALGLAFTNHMTTILLAPGFLYLYFSRSGFGARSWRRIIMMSIPFVIGFSVYLYLPLRANSQPLVNWGNTVDLRRFLWHFTGKQYRVWIFSSTESAAKQFRYFVDTLLPEFAYFPLLLAAAGIWSLVRTHARVAVFTLLLFLGCILYSINYDIHDIDSYFLLAYFTVAIWSAVGIGHILRGLNNRRAAGVAASVFVASAALLVAQNYHTVDESKNRLVEEYTRDMLQSIEPNGIVLTYQWDYFVSAAYYFQLIEQLRPDVTVVDKELLRRSWYFEQLKHRVPWLIDRSKTEVDAFLVELKKFELDQPYNPNLIEYRYNTLIHSIIGKNYPDRPIYATQELESQYTSGYTRVPSGLPFRLYSDTLSHLLPFPQFSFHVPPKTDKYIEGVMTQYSGAYMNSAIYLDVLGKKEMALSQVEKALDLEPNMAQGLYLRDKIKHSPTPGK